MLMEAGMKTLASAIPTGAKDASPGPPKGVGEHFEQRFKALEVITDDGRHIPVVGHIQGPPPFTPAQRRHMASGKAVVLNRFEPNADARIFMSSALDPQNPMRGILLGEINTTFLWNIDMTPPQTELCVLNEVQRPFYCTPGIPPSFRAPLTRKITSLSRGQFEWSYGGKGFLASYWSMPLTYPYLTPGWTVVLSESKADVLAPLGKFKATFPLVVLMALWVVLLLSIIQIRRSLVPLEKLQEGTRRIAMRDFDNRVTVTSKDEFEELATSFNAMAGLLGRQFNALTTISEIDRAVLSALDTEKIVDTVLARLPDVLPCDFASVTLIDPAEPAMFRTYIPSARREDRWWRMPISPEDMQNLRNHRESVVIDRGGNLPTFLGPLKRFGVSSILLLPIFLEQELSGSINIGYRNSPEYSHDDLAQARQLIEKLNQLNWGTLTALARAIDAKSAWTSGHSERVTKLALDVARVMGYAGKDLERMHRGGLLHDIGKIGTPATVLDKPGKLDAEELRIMRDHVRVGEHILKPIPGFAEIMPIVSQHHEWFNGSGYPEGLVGEAISLDARIFAVADCFDALASDRPYRAGLPRKRVTEMIKQGSGTQYDPKVVQAFLRVMEEEEKRESEGVMAAATQSSTSELHPSGPTEEGFAWREAGRREPR